MKLQQNFNFYSHKNYDAAVSLHHSERVNGFHNVLIKSGTLQLL